MVSTAPVDGRVEVVIRQVILGSGPLALAVADELSAKGETGIVVDRKGDATVPPGFRALAADLSRADALDEALGAGRGAIIYQCAAPPYHQWAQFPALQRAILTAAGRAGARVVLGENLYGYGPVTGEMREGTPLAATAKKGRIRARMSEEALDAHRRGDVAVAISRASDYFGPRVVNSALGDRAVGKLVRGGVADVLGDPDQPHSWTYIRDAARTMVRLGIEERALGEVWHVPNNPAISARAMLALVGAQAGTPLKLRPVGALMLRFVGLFDPGARETIEMLYEFDRPFVASDAKIRTAFGLMPSPLEPAIRETVAYFRTRHWRSSAARGAGAGS
jgi:nucleoside-diphosphate-sugar epimerase